MGRKGHLINPSVLTFSLLFLSGGLADFLMHRICGTFLYNLSVSLLSIKISPLAKPFTSIQVLEGRLETITSWHGLGLEELNIYERILNMLNMLVQMGKVSLELECLE